MNTLHSVELIGEMFLLRNPADVASASVGGEKGGKETNKKKKCSQMCHKKMHENCATEE